MDQLLCLFTWETGLNRLFICLRRQKLVTPSWDPAVCVHTHTHTHMTFSTDHFIFIYLFINIAMYMQLLYIWIYIFVLACILMVTYKRTLEFLFFGAIEFKCLCTLISHFTNCWHFYSAWSSFLPFHSSGLHCQRQDQLFLWGFFPATVNHC